MNREQRRTMAKALKARCRALVVLRNGPMSGWTVAPDAPVLAADWRAQFLEAAAEGLYLEARQKGDKRAWAVLGDADRQTYRDDARLIHGDGRYELRPAEALAVWRAV